ncbi:MAG: cysteine desulfurase [Aigarchaeota archaeon]|nr:cysteine desulfurase [Aigarchaeota archaeon]MCX8192738.1 cysteine desulfurase [Nitrososphaeria archaeon]MDW7985990.1 SufS family cysteine desulfurase [Nitrososphaerota archaeon]
MSFLKVEEIRKDFPILEEKIRDRKLVYLDSAASSLKPVQVVEVVKKFELYEYSNIHRGVYTLSQKATQKYEEAREKICKFINANSLEEVIFTYGTTDALNIIAYTYGLKHLQKDDEVLLTIFEHHSNILPWRAVASMKGARIKYVDILDDGRLDYSDFEEKLSEKTKIVSIAQTSNTLGTLVDVKKIAKRVHEVGGVVVIDGAQSVPHLPVDVQDLGIDFLAFSGHKMLGPTGIGVLWVKRDLVDDIPPLRLGGGAIRDVELDRFTLLDPPHRFEAGTPNISGAIGLGAAVEYLMKIGISNVKRHEEELMKYTFKRFEEFGDSIIVYGPKDVSERSGIMLFNVEGMDPNIVGSLLDSYGIAVRSGKHCAHLLYRRLKLDGAVRASYYIYNNVDDVEIFASALEEIIKT